jgi:hypothetical protein
MHAVGRILILRVHGNRGSSPLISHHKKGNNPSAAVVDVIVNSRRQRLSRDADWLDQIELQLLGELNVGCEPSSRSPSANIADLWTLLALASGQKPKGHRLVTVCFDPGHQDLVPRDLPVTLTRELFITLSYSSFWQKQLLVQFVISGKKTKIGCGRRKGEWLPTHLLHCHLTLCYISL